MKWLFLLLIADRVSSSAALKAYLSYQDAVCVDTYTIKGESVVSYEDDDVDYSDYSYSLSYYGGCMYYVGGAFDVDNWEGSLDFYSYGNCVECDGTVGCSSDATCDNFMTYPSQQQQQGGYQMTATGGQDNKMSSEKSKATIESPRFGLASEAKKASLQVQRSENLGNTTTNNDEIVYFIAGAISCVAVFSLVATGFMSYYRRRQSDGANDSNPTVEMPGRLTGEYTNFSESQAAV